MTISRDDTSGLDERMGHGYVIYYLILFGFFLSNLSAKRFTTQVLGAQAKMSLAFDLCPSEPVSDRMSGSHSAERPHRVVSHTGASAVQGAQGL